MAKPKTTAPLSLRAYAKRRGVSAMAVSKAVKSGRLVASVVRDAAGQPKIGDAALADREWEASTDLSKAPGYVKERAAAEEHSSPADEGAVWLGMSLADASAAEKVWRARLAELEFKKKSGELVDAKAMATKIVDVFTKVRTKLLGVPTRAKQQIPHLTVIDIGTLDELVREALEELVEDLEAEDQPTPAPKEEAVG